MKSLCLTLCFGLLLLTGCASVQENRLVTLPDATPFDSNAMSRAAYLDAYQEGYRTAAAGRMVSTDLIQGPYAFSRKLGLRAGAAAYHEAELKKLKENKPSSP